MDIEFKLDRAVLVRTLGWQSRRRFLRSPWVATNKGNPKPQESHFLGLYKGRKDIVHSLRYLLLGIQLLEHVSTPLMTLIFKGRIVDFGCGNEFFYQITRQDSVCD